MVKRDSSRNVAASIKRWVRPDIRAMRAYHIEEPATLIKLDAMENPYGWPEDLRQAWLERLRAVPINRYPDPQARELTRCARQALAIPDAFDILFGNGSDELIQLLCTLVAGEGRKVLLPEPTFEMYGTIARIYGLEVVRVPLDAEHFTVVEDAVLEAVRREQPVVTLLASPNNPTGAAVTPRFIRELAACGNGLVVLDEAYCRFAGGSVLAELTDVDNLLALQTLSKIGLAGLRVGLLLGRRDWLQEFAKVRMPYNVGSLAQASAAFALEHIDVVDDQTARIRAERARVYDVLRRLPGVEVWPSQANFLLMRIAGRGETAFDFIRSAGILVKNLHGKHSMLRDCLRVTIGRPEENDALLAALRALLADGAS